MNIMTIRMPKEREKPPLGAELVRELNECRKHWAKAAEILGRMDISVTFAPPGESSDEYRKNMETANELVGGGYNIFALKDEKSMIEWVRTGTISVPTAFPTTGVYNPTRYYTLEFPGEPVSEIMFTDAVNAYRQSYWWPSNLTNTGGINIGT